MVKSFPPTLWIGEMFGMGVKNNNSGKEKSTITDLDNMIKVDGSRFNLMVLVVLVHIKMFLYLLSSLSYDFSSVTQDTLLLILVFCLSI